MGEKLNVLIVEDDSQVAEYLKRQLAEIGYGPVMVAKNYAEALRLIEEGPPPSLIFMDIFLGGGKNGIDTAMKIYSQAHVPLIFISSPENRQVVDDAKFIKSSSFLSKPFDLEEIRASIRNTRTKTKRQTPGFIEAERLMAVNKYEILDTPTEGNFDRITRLAAKLLNVPVALVSIVDQDRIWFKSRYGYDQRELKVDSELAGEFFNGRMEEGITNALKAKESGYAFYACSALITVEGNSLGALCVMDRKPRKISEKEQEILDSLAALVMDEMEMRLAARKAYRLQREFISTAVHDLKNPLAGILGFSNLIKENDDLKTLKEYNGYVNQSAEKMLEIVEGLLETSLMELEQVKLKREQVYFSDIVHSVIVGNKSQARAKNQKLNINIKGDAQVFADAVKLQEALDNLLSNAIKYSPPNQPIDINVEKLDGKISFTVKDHGPGLEKEELERVFEKFAHLSPVPTGDEVSTGLGLSIAKSLVEMHGGSIGAKSEGKGRGAEFRIELPEAKKKEQREPENMVLDK